MIIDYAIHQECKNKEAWYMCLKCGKCGRVFEDGFLIKSEKDEKEIEE